MNTPRFLLADSYDPRTMLHGMARDIAKEASLVMDECVRDCASKLADASNYFALLISTDRPDALDIARLFYPAAGNEMQFIFIVGKSTHFAFLEVVGSSGELGNNWTVARRHPADLTSAITNALRGAEQRRRYRTQLL